MHLDGQAAGSHVPFANVGLCNSIGRNDWSVPHLRGAPGPHRSRGDELRSVKRLEERG
jgi:hypothetical protein